MRLLHIFCAVVYLSAGAVVALCVLDRGDTDPDANRLCNQPSVVRRFEKLRDERDGPTAADSQLVVAAQAFAAYLDGPAAATPREVAAAAKRPPTRRAAKVRSAAVVPSARFTVEGTSYYPDRPERSIALISEAGSPERNQYWVRQGERLGRFVIHRIGQGVVVYRDDNEQLHEMSIARKAASRSLVRDYISSVAMVPTGPDSNSVAD